MCETKYVPQVGDRIRGSWWDKHDIQGWYDVKAVGEKWMIVVNQDGKESTAVIDQRGGHWVKVVKPTPCPERVWNVYPESLCYMTEAEADTAASACRIGKLFLRADGTCKFVRTEVLS